MRSCSRNCRYSPSYLAPPKSNRLSSLITTHSSTRSRSLDSPAHLHPIGRHAMEPEEIGRGGSRSTSDTWSQRRRRLSFGSLPCSTRAQWSRVVLQSEATWLRGGLIQPEPVILLGFSCSVRVQGPILRGGRKCSALSRLCPEIRPLTITCTLSEANVAFGTGQHAEEGSRARHLRGRDCRARLRLVALRNELYLVTGPYTLSLWSKLSVP